MLASRARYTRMRVLRSTKRTCRLGKSDGLKSRLPNGLSFSHSSRRFTRRVMPSGSAPSWLLLRVSTCNRRQ